MITTRINFNGSKVRLGPGLGFQKYQMLTLGQFAVDTIKARVAKGVGSDDAAMKPLVDRYAKRKQQYGRQPIRDLHGPGQVTYQKRIYEQNAGQHFQGKTTKYGPSFYGWRNGWAPIRRHTTASGESIMAPGEPTGTRPPTSASGARVAARTCSTTSPCATPTS